MLRCNLSVKLHDTWKASTFCNKLSLLLMQLLSKGKMLEKIAPELTNVILLSHPAVQMMMKHTLSMLLLLSQLITCNMSDILCSDSDGNLECMESYPESALSSSGSFDKLDEPVDNSKHGTPDQMRSLTSGDRSDEQELQSHNSPHQASSASGDRLDVTELSGNSLLAESDQTTMNVSVGDRFARQNASLECLVEVGARQELLVISMKCKVFCQLVKGCVESQHISVKKNNKL